MLPRKKSDAASRLRHSKSTSSALRRSTTSRSSTSEDPARQHAITAANLAFDKSHGSNARASVSSAQGVSFKRAKGREGTHLARSREGSNVAFARKSPRTSSEQRISDWERSILQATPRSQNSSSGFLSSPRSLDTRKTLHPRSTAFAASPNTSQANDKGAKLLSTGEPSNPESCPTLIRKENKSRILSQRLDPFTSAHLTPTARENQSDEAIIALARDKYLQDYQNHGLRKSKSFVNNRFMKSFANPKRASQQRESNFSSETAVASSIHSKKHENSSYASSKKRGSLTASIKSKWKNTFGRSSREKPEMPPQQVQAYEQHYSRIPSNMTSTERSVTTVVHGGSDPFWRSETPAQDAFTTDAAFPDGGLFHDFDMAMADDSRVTSWADTSTQNTAAWQEVGHMSVIKECAESRDASSSTVRKDPGSLSRKRFSIPKRKSSAIFHESNTVDSKRLLSALVRQMRSTSFGKQQDALGSPNVQQEGEGNFGAVSNPETMQSEPPFGKFQMSSTIRTVRDPMPFEVPEVLAEFGSMSAARQSNTSIMSPSIYTLRNESQVMTPTDRAAASSNATQNLDHGTAYITESHPISKWKLRKPVGQQETRGPITSGEWRAWVTDEMAPFETSMAHVGIASTTEHVHGKAMGHLRESAQIDEPRTSPDEEERQSSSTYRIPSDRMRWDGELRSAMNERFPMLDTGRKTSAHTIASTTGTSAMPVKAPSVTTLPVRPVTILAEPVGRNKKLPLPNLASPNPLANVVPAAPRHRESDRNVTILSAIGARKPPVDELAPQRRTSTQSLRDRNVNNNESFRRRLTRQPSNLDENFLLRIRKGPYESQTPSPKSRPSPKRDENTPPTKGQQLADEFLSNRSSGGSKSVLDGRVDSSPAFL